MTKWKSITPPGELNPREILRMSRTQYREFAELAKREAGCVLALSNFDELRGWGALGIMAAGAYLDATDPNTLMAEYGEIRLVPRINVRQLKSALRPEIDWGAVPNERIFEFVMWHEIGHARFNFSIIDLVCNSELRDTLGERYKDTVRRVRKANEVLADRYAWNAIFPDLELPVRGDLSARERGLFDLEIEHLGEVLELKERAIKPCPSGQYKCVHYRMLRSKRLAAYVGPEAIVRH